MKLKDVLIELFYLLVYADGKVNEKEIALGKQMVKIEGFGDDGFDKLLESLKSKDKSVLLNECVAALRKLENKQQIRYLAWLCVIANADGFMDNQEWVLIYKIYHTELSLPLDEIMKTQKELNMIIHGKSFNSLGIKVND